MARGKTKKEEEDDEKMEATIPEVTERKRLKALAFSSNILSETLARSSVHLNPSSTVTKHHSKDIIKKSHRKSKRSLLSFPGLFVLVASGKIGDLKDLGTKNPILYLDFPLVLPLFYLPFSISLQFWEGGRLVHGFAQFFRDAKNWGSSSPTWISNLKGGLSLFLDL